MYLEIHESPGKTGEVHLNPYSYTYEGPNADIERLLAKEPKFEGAISSTSEKYGFPEYAEITDPKEYFAELSSLLRSQGAWRCEIINE